MYCKNCGASVGQHSKFCFICGSDLVDAPIEKLREGFENMIYSNAVFIDSVFVKHTIEEAKKYYPNVSEENISIESIIERIIAYTNYENYEVFYFEVSSVPGLIPKIQKNSMGKSVLINDKPIKFRKIETGLIAIEICEYFLKNHSNYRKNILIADDIIYGDLLPRNGNIPNLTIFRRREYDSRMAWGFYDKHGYFIDIIGEINEKK